MTPHAATFGMHHMGFTVANVDEAVSFFETMFGATALIRVLSDKCEPVSVYR
jgi:hypothetical protein